MKHDNDQNDKLSIKAASFKPDQLFILLKITNHPAVSTGKQQDKQ